MTDEITSGPPDSGRRDAVRAKAKQVQARQTRNRILRRVLGGLVVLAIVIFGGLSIFEAFRTQADRPQALPENLPDDSFSIDQSVLDAIARNSEDGAGTPAPRTSVVDIRIYVDYLSEQSGAFESANAEQLYEWIGEGAVTVSYRPVSMLNASSNGSIYSDRAMAAVACVATQFPQALTSFNHLLLTQQPATGGEGYTDEEIAKMASDLGIPDDSGVSECIIDQRFVSWAKDATERALSGVLPGTEDVTLASTPLILVNGRPFTGAVDDPADLSQFVLTVASEDYFLTEPPTPEPTETTPAPDVSETPAPDGSETPSPDATETPAG